MSSWVSHLPEDMSFERVEGQGMNEAELLANTRLHRFWVQDLNKSQHLPHKDGTFDAVLISLAIQYLERPKEIIQEIARVLAPGGLLIVTFSKHSYGEKAVAGWLRRTAEKRLDLVKSMLQTAGFEDIETVLTHELGDENVSTLSDPFYAIVGVKRENTDLRTEALEDLPTHDSLAFQTLSQAEDSVEDGSSSDLLETWANAYEVMAKEAMDLGIPRKAIPKLEPPLTRTSVIEARDLLSGIIQSRMCSNL
ncbi:hypothetical protein KFL_005340010 [Klebsormidium nitens]|uniref:Methyltransferase type 11 domain-containing protein n=1 Tax=Klebsormidium nitens TaxID=105231 RepID=A0A1Y1IL95_KLENI|nr:hypothetical protein KFL_005340010 [Klebsormidium nitens]|eukprot:GAQ89536.1 hypothetical protein KFL_005340010 [Klebsormidium nitens]